MHREHRRGFHDERHGKSVHAVGRDFPANALPQLPEGDDTTCQTDTDWEVFPGVNTQAIMEKLPTVGF